MNKLMLSFSAGLFAVILSLGAYVYHLGGEKALLQSRLHASDSTIAILAQRTATTDTVYVRDTVRLKGAIRRYETIKTQVETVTVAVPVEVVREVFVQADAALNACRSVIMTCEERVAQRDSTISLLRAQRPLIEGQRDGRFKRVIKTAGWFTLGVAGGYIVAKQSP
jgi:hypothetical protein